MGGSFHDEFQPESIHRLQQPGERRDAHSPQSKCKQGPGRHEPEPCPGAKQDAQPDHGRRQGHHGMHRKSGGKCQPPPRLAPRQPRGEARQAERLGIQPGGKKALSICEHAMRAVLAAQARYQQQRQNSRCNRQ